MSRNDSDIPDPTGRQYSKLQSGDILEARILMTCTNRGESLTPFQSIDLRVVPAQHSQGSRQVLERATTGMAAASACSDAVDAVDGACSRIEIDAHIQPGPRVCTCRMGRGWDEEKRRRRDCKRRYCRYRARQTADYWNAQEAYVEGNECSVAGISEKLRSGLCESVAAIALGSLEATVDIG